MDDDRAFLDEILAQPDDDLPRLIYADWLEERGDPRGELIRVQCELAKLTATDSRRKVLEERGRLLVLDHYESWIEEPLILLGVGKARFVRGLVEEIELDAQVFLEIAESLFHAAPLMQRVWLRKSARVLEQFAASPHLSRLAGLHLTGGWSYQDGKNPYRAETLGDAGVQVLSSSTHLAHLTSLGLATNEIGPGGIRFLANSRSLNNLSELDLSDNSIRTEGARVLASWPQLTRLTSLNLSRTGMTLADLKLLGQSPFWNRKTRVVLEHDELKESERVELSYWFHVRVVAGSG